MSMDTLPAVTVPGGAESIAKLNAEIRREATKSTVRALTRALLTFVLTIVAVLVIWVGALGVF